MNKELYVDVVIFLLLVVIDIRQLKFKDSDSLIYILYFLFIVKYNLFVLDVVIDFEKSLVIDIKVQVIDRGGLLLKKNFIVRVEDVNEKFIQISFSQNKVIIENYKINVGFFWGFYVFLFINCLFSWVFFWRLLQKIVIL